MDVRAGFDTDSNYLPSGLDPHLVSPRLINAVARSRFAARSLPASLCFVVRLHKAVGPTFDNVTCPSTLPHVLPNNSTEGQI